jgi:4-carboxymuconolactone decarboxylase
MNSARFPTIPEDKMTAAQRKAAEGIIKGPRGSIRGPFNTMLRSPEFADRAQRVGEFVRFHSSLPPALKELAILVTARHWTAQYEWYAHRKLAIEAGVSAAHADAIAQGKRPSGLTDAETAVYDFASDLLYTKQVSDAVFAKAREHLGEQGVVDLIGTVGYYSLVSMCLNVDRYPIPEDAQPLKPLK